MKLRTVALLTMAIAGSILCPIRSYCAPADGAAPGGGLTIYNENFAVVRDTIPLDLKYGSNKISYTGITSQLEPDSVILRDPTGKRTLSILEQNYRGDTVSQGLLLSLNEGKTIDFQVAGVNGAPPTIVQGKIIRSGYKPGAQPYNPYGYNPNQPDSTPLVEVNGKLQFSLPGIPLFPELADDSILNPTLEWTIFSDKDGPLNAELAYITEGITWSASYNVVAPAEGSNLDLSAWVTIDNESGKEFDDAKIKLMAGDVNKIKPNQYHGGYDGIIADSTDNSLLTTGLATQQALDEYHLYTLPNSTTLRNRETKQVEFQHAGNIASKELYVYDGVKIDPNQYGNWGYDNIRNSSDYGTQSNTKVSIERDFVNSVANGLGVPLPAGRVRFYRRDSDGLLEFIGENDIDHTPQDETVRIVTGNAFDIIGSRTQTNYSIDNGRTEADNSFSIVVTNHKNTPVNVTIVEHLYRSETWTIPASSDPFIKKDSSTINFNVSVPADASKTVTYTAHYMW